MFLVLLKRFDSLFTVRNSSCGKVMFSQASVILSTRRVACVAGGMHGRGLGGGVCVVGGMHGREDGHCGGRYASYWNAFLF